MGKSFFFVLFCFVFLVSSVYAIECSSNQCFVPSSDSCVNTGSLVNLSGTVVYCDIDSVLKVQKNIGESCSNHYQCVNYKCIEGLCQGRYISRNQTIIETLFNSIFGVIIHTCNNDGDCDAGENSNNCPSDCNSGPGGNNPGGGGGGCTQNSDCSPGYYCNTGHKCVLLCTSYWVCGSWSNSAFECGTRTCKDTKNCTTPTNKPAELRGCNIPGPIEDTYCGDLSCNGGEGCDSCPEDCGICGGSTDLGWLWVLLIILLIIVIGVIIFFIIYNYTKSNKKTKKVVKKDISKSQNFVQQNLRTQIKNPASIFPVLPFNNQKIGVNSSLANQPKNNKFPVR